MGSTGFIKCVPADLKATFDQTIDSTALDFDVDRHFLMSNKKQIIIIGGNLADMRKTNCEEVRSPRFELFRSQRRDGEEGEHKLFPDCSLKIILMAP